MKKKKADNQYQSQSKPATARLPIVDKFDLLTLGTDSFVGNNSFNAGRSTDRSKSSRKHKSGLLDSSRNDRFDSASKVTNLNCS